MHLLCNYKLQGPIFITGIGSLYSLCTGCLQLYKILHLKIIIMKEVEYKNYVYKNNRKERKCSVNLGHYIQKQ